MYCLAVSLNVVIPSLELDVMPRDDNLGIISNEKLYTNLLTCSKLCTLILPEPSSTNTRSVTTPQSVDCN